MSERQIETKPQHERLHSYSYEAIYEDIFIHFQGSLEYELTLNVTSQLRITKPFLGKTYLISTVDYVGRINSSDSRPSPIKRKQVTCSLHTEPFRHGKQILRLERQSHCIIKYFPFRSKSFKRFQIIDFIVFPPIMMCVCAVAIIFFSLSLAFPSTESSVLGETTRLAYFKFRR